MVRVADRQVRLERFFVILDKPIVVRALGRHGGPFWFRWRLEDGAPPMLRYAKQ
jgi:hypothetical protein